MLVPDPPTGLEIQNPRNEAAVPLEKYREKRDFKKTPEPSGKVKKPSRAKPKPLSFVVHKHKASHLHWDLRLELDGVLKSWAVPKRPTLDPGEKRLAMMVEDHPLEYGSFEGIIPPGNYGAGTVMIWDEGTYHAAHHEDRGESEEALRQGLEKGHISVVFNGKRLKGEFAIVRIKKASDTSWLMIKKHDEFAGPDAEGPQGEDRSAETGRTMEEIAGGKEEPHKGIPSPRNVDLRGAPKSAVPTAIKPMLATLVDEPFDRAGWLFEIKWDGYRALARLHGGAVLLYSRNGKVLNQRFPPIAESLKRLPFNAVFDGEVVVVDENGRSDFQLLQNYMRSGEGNLVYYVFDVLHFRGHDLTGLPLSRRKSILARIMPDPPLPHIRISEHMEEKGTSLFQAAAENNLEGIIAKDGASPYRAGTRSREWLKVKTAMRQEAVIGGFTEPRGGRKFFGSLLLGVYDNGELRLHRPQRRRVHRRGLEGYAGQDGPPQDRRVPLQDAAARAHRCNLDSARTGLRGAVHGVDSRGAAAPPGLCRAARGQGPPGGAQGKAAAGRRGPPQGQVSHCRRPEENRRNRRQAPRALQPRQGLLAGRGLHERGPDRLLPVRCPRHPSPPQGQAAVAAPLAKRYRGGGFFPEGRRGGCPRVGANRGSAVRVRGKRYHVHALPG